MNEFIKIRVPFYKRITNGGTDGLATFYLKEMPKYLPQSVGSKVIITHTDIADSSGLKTKLNNLSTNTVVGYFQQVDENISPDSIYQSDGYSIFFVAQYEDLSFSTNQFAGNCRGYIEYYVAPSALNILKPIETSVIVSEKIPFNDEEGYIKLLNEEPPNTGITKCYKCMFIDREDKETIFSSLLKSLNVPITAEEKKKYTRSPLGYLQPSTIKTDIIQNGYYYDWIEYTGGTQPSANLIVHPTTGFTGEYFNTVLETISIDKSHNISGTPIDNRLYFVMEIPNKKYGEIIDGKSVHIILNGIYDIYGTYNKKNLTTSNLDNVLSEIDLSVKDIGSPVTLNNGDYESNVVLLFATGSTGTDWAKGYSDILAGDKVFNSTNPLKETYNYYTDRCVGYAVLDKGFIVITDKTIVHGLFESVFSGTIEGVGNDLKITFPTGSTAGGCITHENTDFIVTKDINNNNNIEWNNTQFHITGTTNYIEYFSYNTEKSLNIVCLASCDEFYKSTNDTAKELLNLEENADVADFKTDDLNLHPIMISQIGIHDSDGNLLAICKPNQPIKKYWHDILSFNIKIRI